MGKKGNKAIQVTDRDRRILQHVARQRMTTVEAVQALFFPDNKRDAAKSTLRRLYGSPPEYRFLHPEPLDARRVYYRLTPPGAKLIGAAKEAAQPLGVQARVERYALLWFFCIDRPQQRSIFDPRKFPDQFPIHGERLPRKAFYLDEDDAGDVRLGYVLVDHRSDGRRLVRKAGQMLQRFLRRGWFDDFVKACAFELTVLTATEEKRATLLRALDRKLPGFLQPHRDSLGVTAVDALPVQVKVVPGLIDLLPGTAGKGTPA